LRRRKKKKKKKTRKIRAQFDEVSETGRKTVR
jgi:hypothetical protein